MNKNKIIFTAITIFLLQLFAMTGAVRAESYLPNPLTEILTKGACFQPKVQVSSEVIVENFGVTLQVLPDIKEMLDDCSIKPNKIYGSSQVDKSA